MSESAESEFVRVAEAAEYVGVSPQTLRRWDRDGTLPAVRRPGSRHRYYRRVDLEPFRLEYRRAEGASSQTSVFTTANANIEANDLLREPQKEAHRAAREHFANSQEPGILQIPVGCGKTGIMATLPFGISEGRVLVITPNLTIRKGVTDALDVTSRECFWTKTRVLSDFTAGPWTAVLDGARANVHDAIESDFVVTNVQQLASRADRWLPQFPPDFFDMILVDEGHHAPAESWQKVFRRFPDARVISLTATPFRADQQQMHGEVLYRFSFTRAMVNGYIKQISSRNVAPAELYFTYADDSRTHTLDEVLELREEAWFRRGVALSEECNRHIVETSIQQCNAMRADTGIKHQIIAAACSVDHARQVRALYEECGYVAAEIHSGMDEDEIDAVLERLKTGTLDCIVQVQMLGEGFDHPRLSVAAIFRPYRSLAPYIQFVGRVMRVVQQNQPDHPDNRGFVVSHVGLNNDERWSEFRELDLEDQELIHDWTTGTGDPAIEGTETDGEGRARRFDNGMLVNNEILASFIDQAYLDPNDDRVLEEMLDREVAPGLQVRDIITLEQLRAGLLAKQAAQPVDEPLPIPVSPQRKRQSARTRLNERTMSVANRVLQDLELPRNGFALMKVTRGPRQSNLRVATRLLNAAVTAELGDTRGEASAAELTRVFNDLDAIADRVRDDIVKKL